MAFDVAVLTINCYQFVVLWFHGNSPLIYLAISLLVHINFQTKTIHEILKCPIYTTIHTLWFECVMTLWKQTQLWPLNSSATVFPTPKIPLILGVALLTSFSVFYRLRTHHFGVAATDGRSTDLFILMWTLHYLWVCASQAHTNIVSKTLQSLAWCSTNLH